MEVSRIVHEMPKPVVAMIRGPAAGASLSIALACDMRVASETALITTGFAQVALSGDFGQGTLGTSRSVVPLAQLNARPCLARLVLPWFQPRRVLTVPDWFVQKLRNSRASEVCAWLLVRQASGSRPSGRLSRARL